LLLTESAGCVVSGSEQCCYLRLLWIKTWVLSQLTPTLRWLPQLLKLATSDVGFSEKSMCCMASSLDQQTVTWLSFSTEQSPISTTCRTRL